MKREAWPYAKVLRTQLENAAARCAREQRLEGTITAEQAQAILGPLRQAIAAAMLVEAAPPHANASGPDVQVQGAVPREPAPEPAPKPVDLEDACAMYGGIYGQ